MENRTALSFDGACPCPPDEEIVEMIKPRSIKVVKAVKTKKCVDGKAKASSLNRKARTLMISLHASLMLVIRARVRAFSSASLDVDNSHSKSVTISTILAKIVHKQHALRES